MKTIADIANDATSMATVNFITYKILYEAYIRSGLYESKHEVIKRNIIDFSKYSLDEYEELANIDGDCNADLDTKKFFHIPPFESGVIKFRTDEDHIIYSTWDIKSIDLDEMKVDIEYNIYEFNNTMAKIWRILSEVHAYIDLNSMRVQHESNYITTKVGLEYDLFERYYNIYSDMISEYINVSPEEFSCKKIYDAYVKTTNDYKYAKDQKEYNDKLLMMTEGMIYLFNELLYMKKNKTNIIRSTSKKSKSSVSSEIKNERKVRTLDHIIITSDKKPRVHTSVNTIRKYKCASWTVRGHLRTYKSGKQVYIKEKVHKRHNINVVIPKATRKIKMK